MNTNKDRIYIPLIVTLSVAVPVVVAALILFPEAFKVDMGSEVRQLPFFHAVLNGTTAGLLLTGLMLIKAKRIALHRTAMVTAFVLSAVFLVSYVISKISNDPVPYGGEGIIRGIYFFILISHILLSVPVLPLAMLSIYRGWTKDFVKHKKIAKWTFPIWFYVAVTGVLVYIFMQPYYPQP